ncbi:hypothetical protein SASPL_131292 [Salvia splendens]|uniref:PsbP C-terminal domain-containing protein n=1 Tax=Salvia splendens TaxID=180675 RepID=A0A8X8ZK67_SALSN|nr:hypothetical protein SASPL_131292 [Salvia splendens]
MGTVMQTVSSLCWRNCPPSQQKLHSKTRGETQNVEFGGVINRREAISSGIALLSSAAAFGFPGDGLAVVKQGLLAGRIPGLSEPDEQGWRTYQRPEDKSGGHGVGWSPIIPYKFSVPAPAEWNEVSINASHMTIKGYIVRFFHVIPSTFFRESLMSGPTDLGDNTTIDRIGTPEKVISAFGPEVIGENVEGKVLSSQVAEHEGRTYYQFELEPPHVIITATAAGNRLYLFNVTGNGLQWKKHYKDLKKIADSFRVV